MTLRAKLPHRACLAAGVPLMALLLAAGCSRPPQGERAELGAPTSPPEAALKENVVTPPHEAPDTSSTEPAALAAQNDDSPQNERSAAAPSTSQLAPRAEGSPAPAKHRYVVAALGDSITDARSGGGGYLKYLREKCPASTFDDFGKGGDMTNQMRRRFERDIVPRVKKRGYNTLLVYGGVNDLYSNITASRTNERIEGDLNKIYDQARAAGLEVVAITVSPWGGFTRYFNQERSDNTRLLNSWILGQVRGGPLRVAVDSYPLLSCGTPERLCPRYENGSKDGLHPGAEGHRVLGKAIFEQAFGDCK